jgi:hypothetical protein
MSCLWDCLFASISSCVPYSLRLQAFIGDFYALPRILAMLSISWAPSTCIHCFISMYVKFIWASSLHVTHTHTHVHTTCIVLGCHATSSCWCIMYFIWCHVTKLG